MCTIHDAIRRWGLCGWASLGLPTWHSQMWATVLSHRQMKVACFCISIVARPYQAFGSARLLSSAVKVSSKVLWLGYYHGSGHVRHRRANSGNNAWGEVPPPPSGPVRQQCKWQLSCGQDCLFPALPPGICLECSTVSLQLPQHAANGSRVLQYNNLSIVARQAAGVATGTASVYYMPAMYMTATGTIAVSIGAEQQHKHRGHVASSLSFQLG